MIHELKILPEFFKGVLSGEKSFEIRNNDRNYKVGDLLALNEFNGNYTGNSCLVQVNYIIDDPTYVKENTVVMGIKMCSVFTEYKKRRIKKWI